MMMPVCLLMPGLTWARYVTRTPAWHGPYWLWVGPDGQEPDCPPEPQAGGKAWDGHAELVASDECPCTCGPSAGSCELPSMLTAHDVLCQDVEQMHNDTPFNAPVSWDGKCDVSTKVSAGAAQSVTIAPLTMKQEPCEPVSPVIPKELPYSSKLPYAWERLGRSCYGWGWSWSQNPDTVCIPSDALMPKDFRLCIMHEGEVQCKDDTWPDGHLLYDDVNDERQCGECTCGPPMGGNCSASISVYEDGVDMCASPPLLTLTVETDMPKCGDTPINTALGSKSTGPMTYTPGICQPMPATASGSITEMGPVTFCCQH
jgi:hypothetical protein